MCLAFFKSLFAVTKGSRRIGTARISKIEAWVKCNSCFIFAFRKHIHKSFLVVKFNLKRAQFVLFRWLLFTACCGSFLSDSDLFWSVIGLWLTVFSFLLSPSLTSQRTFDLAVVSDWI